jgi:hypothetical protein
MDIATAPRAKKPRERGFFVAWLSGHVVAYCEGGAESLPVSTICIGSAAACERGGRERPRLTGSSVT